MKKKAEEVAIVYAGLIVYVVSRKKRVHRLFVGGVKVEQREYSFLLLAWLECSILGIMAGQPNYLLG